MSDRWEFRNLGRMGPATGCWGMYPYGEPDRIRQAYDDMIRRGDDATTRICQNCQGSGSKGGKQCTACHGAGSLPAAPSKSANWA